MDGDDCDVGIGISSLKGEVYFEAILVICCHRRNTYDNLNKKKKIALDFSCMMGHRKTHQPSRVSRPSPRGLQSRQDFCPTR